VQQMLAVLQPCKAEQPAYLSKMPSWFSTRFFLNALAEFTNKKMPQTD
jgi:hypothetical protein